MTNTINRNVYGTVETNGLVDGLQYHKERADARSVDWTTPGLKVTRLRLISDPGLSFWDVSYCYGVLNGENVRVGLPFSQLRKRGYVGEIIEHARREGVYAKSLGILDNISTLI